MYVYHLSYIKVVFAVVESNNLTHTMSVTIDFRKSNYTHVAYNRNRFVNAISCYF